MQPQTEKDLVDVIINLGNRLAVVEKALTNDAVPIGTAIEWTGPLSLLPFNYLPADGRAIDRISYASYFAQIGTTQGIGDGISTFNIPTESSITSISYNELTSNVTISGTSGAQTSVISSSSVTLDGSTSILVEFFSPDFATGASDFIVVELWDGATDLGVMGQVGNVALAVGNTFSRRLTPSAGAHTYTIKAYRGTTNGTIVGGIGGTGAYVPLYIRVCKESNMAIKVL